MNELFQNLLKSINLMGQYNKNTNCVLINWLIVYDYQKIAQYLPYSFNSSKTNKCKVLILGNEKTVFDQLKDLSFHPNTENDLKVLGPNFCCLGFLIDNTSQLIGVVYQKSK